jgi:hypothetical protein
VTSPEYRFLTKWFTVRPLFAANHRWAMATGEISLAREIARRRGAEVGPPPQPTFRR